MITLLQWLGLIASLSTGAWCVYQSYLGDEPKKLPPVVSPEDQYMYDLQIQHQEAIRSWDSEFQSATGKRVDWLLDPELEARERRKGEAQWKEVMAPGLQALINRQQLPHTDYMQQQIQNQQFNIQQQILAQQGLLGQFGSGQPLDMSPFLAAMGIIQPKKPS